MNPNALPFRVLRYFGSLPAVLIVLALLLSGLSAAQAVTNHGNDTSQGFIFARISAALVGK